MATLGIKLRVRRCDCPEHQKGRVRFVVGDRCRPGEALVLRRWQARSQEPDAQAKGITYDGCRLPSGTVRLLNACFAAGLKVGAVSAAVLRPYYEAAREANPLWRAPQVDKAADFLTCLATRRRLTRILERERSAASPGLPDLFLWRRTRDGALIGGRFIEVKRKVPSKKYVERTSPAQREEIKFLKELGLKAGVVYLIQA